MSAAPELKDPARLVCQAPSCDFEVTVEDADSARLADEHEASCGDQVMIFLPSNDISA